LSIDNLTILFLVISVKKTSLCKNGCYNPKNEPPYHAFTHKAIWNIFQEFFKFEGSPKAITRTGNKIEAGSQRCS